jgi:hypothetical protein
MLGSRPQQDTDPFYAVVLLRKSSDTTAAWKRDELAPLHSLPELVAQFGAEIARLAFNWDVPDDRSGSRSEELDLAPPMNWLIVISRTLR